MKKIVLLLTIFCLLFLSVCAEESGEEDVEGILDMYTEIYGDGISEITNRIENENIQKLIPGFSPQELLSDMVHGRTSFSVGAVIEKGISVLFGEMRNTARFLLIIIAIAILCTYLINIQNSFQHKDVSGTAFFVCYLIISGIAAATLMETVNCGKNLVGNIAIFMRIMVPVVMTTLVTSGAPVSASSFELVMVGIIEITEWIIEIFFIPMLMMTAALSIVNNLSESVNAEKLVQFMNKMLKWGIGIIMTVFVGVMSLQGIVSGGADGLTLKITKFATSNLIPIVGGSLAETVDTVISCGAVIKNSVGVLGVIIVILMSAVPILKIGACLIMFRLCAAVLQPISDKRIVKCISELADTVAGVMGLTSAVTVMFIILLTIVIRFAV